MAMNAFFHGLLFGLTITISFGPGFIAIFQTSIGKGFLSGMILATGILISDILLISLSYLGIAEFIHKTQNQFILGIIAGCILIVTGLVSAIKKNTVQISGIMMSSQKTSTARLLLKGFFLNIANPFSLIFWLSMMGLAASNYGSRSPHIYAFFSGVIVTAFGSDLLKCYFSDSLKKHLSSNVIDAIHKVAGIALAAIGVALLCKVV